MAGHDGVRSGRNRRAKRHQLQVFQTFAARRNHRQVDVGIRRSVAVPREMLGRGQCTAVRDALYERGHKLPDALRIFSERSRINDGIGRVVVYV